MTGHDALEEIFEATTAAAADYHVAESQVEGVTERLPQLSASLQAAHLHGLLHSGLLGVAAQHHNECDLTSCRTCDAIRHALTTSLAGLRVLVGRHSITHDPRGPRRLPSGISVNHQATPMVKP